MNPINFKTKRVSRFKNSPEGEQRLIREFFQDKPDGFYVDVGANEPIFNSQTFHLEQIGWDGLLIEPLPSYCAELTAQRTGRVVQSACSSPENHGKTLKLLVAGGHSTLNPTLIAMGSESQIYTEVVTKTLDSTLEECKAPVAFDFISIDIEGHEMEMFKGFTLKKWMPKLVLLEDHVTSHDKHRHMVRCNYQLILRTGLNSWYVPTSLGYTLSSFAKLQAFRKYWIGLLFRKWQYAR